MEEESSKTSKRLHMNVKLIKISHIRYKKYCQALLILFKNQFECGFIYFIYIVTVGCYCFIVKLV